MKNLTIRFCVIMIFILMTSICIVAAGAETYATWGDGETTVTFFAVSSGNASITLRQEEGICYELSYTHLIDGLTGNEEEWGKYHIKIVSPSGMAYTEEWDKSFYGSEYTLKFPLSGTYRVTLVPYTGDEMTASWTLDKFVGWEKLPKWWVNSCSNSYVTEKVGTYIYVQQVDIDTNTVMSQHSTYVEYGNNTVYAGSTPTGFTLLSNPTATVKVDQNSRADSSIISFYYQREKTTTPTPSNGTNSSANNTRTQGTSNNQQTSINNNSNNNSNNTKTQGISNNQQTQTSNNINRSSNVGSTYDIGIPNLNGRVYRNGDMNVTVLWVQCQMKATEKYYQGDNWDETGNLGNHTMQEIASFMKSRGYSNHSGNVDQNVIDELASYLGNRRVPVYVGGFYDHMNTIMTGGSAGSMETIVSNMRDGVARTTTGARWVQTCLSKLGYYNSTIDGKYGQGTENAVNRFQRDYGFVERDYVSLGVARAMLEACYQRGCNLDDLP